MRKTSSRSFLHQYEDSDSGDNDSREPLGLSRRLLGGKVDDDIESISGTFQCMTLQKRKTLERDHLSLEKYDLWRKQQKMRAAKLEKKLKKRWELEDLIEDHLNRLHAHYSRPAMDPMHLKGVAELLTPNWAQPHELAFIGWFGDWRPSAIVDLLRGLAGSSSSFSDPASIQGNLSKVAHEIRIEEAIIDEEMAEIQATCVLNLPFVGLDHQVQVSGSNVLSCLQSEFTKIKRVINKGQQLRFKTVELIVRKVLNPIDAAEFLVTFEKIQDAIHKITTRQGLRNGPFITLPAEATLGLMN